MADRLPIIILAAQDAAAAADDPILAASLSMVINYHEVALLLPVTAEDEEHARRILAILRGEDAVRTVITARVAGAMAATAANLRAIEDPAYDEIIERLWSGATALMGRSVLPGLRAVR